jgi:ubiquinol-cytochrome c reductase cytochrome b subunit
MIQLLRAVWAWVDERAALSPILKHPVPRESGWRSWMYVLGSATLTSFLIAVITGIPIATIYIPSTGQAYNSILWLDNVAVLGTQLRALHNISATAMLVLVGLHAMRVFLTGSFKYPRELNWLSGVALLFLTVGLLFTGQILRWDSAGLWTMSIIASITSRVPIIGTALAHFMYGGQTMTGMTLSRYFALHVFVLPGLLLLIVGFHLYLVIKVGISESPRTGRPVHPRTYRAWYEDLLKREGIPFWPDVAWRDAVFSALVIVVIIALALAIGPPALAGPPDPTMVIVQPRPDWYFIWVYAALALLPKGMENFTMILAPLLLVVIFLVLPFTANKGERSLIRRPWAGIVAGLAVLMVMSLIVTGELAPWSPRFEDTALPKPAIAGLTGAAARGARLFSTAGCQFCHSYYGTSGGIRGPGLDNIGSQLTPQELTVRILDGGTNMPSFAGSLSPAQVHDLVAFLETRHLWANSTATRHPSG